MLGPSREEKRRLPSRVSSAHDGDLRVAAKLGLHRGRAIVDPGAFELSDVGYIQLAIWAPGRHNHAPALHRSSIVQFDRVGRTGAFDPTGGSRDRNLRAELLRLHERAVSQVLPRNTGWEPEVIF